MLKRLAQDIVKSSNKIISYNIIITDAKSIIIGSTDESLIGNIFEISTTVIKTGKQKIIDTNSANSIKDSKPCITIPLFLAKKIVGTVSITGEPNDVSNYGFLIKEQIELLLREEIFYKDSLLREQALQHFIQEIATFNPKTDDANTIINYGKEFGFDLSLPRITIIIEPDLTKDLQKQTIDNNTYELQIKKIKLNVLSTITSVFINPQNISAFMGTDKFVVLPALINTNENAVLKKIQKKISLLTTKLAKKDITVNISVGPIAKDISGLAHSYNMAWQTLIIGKKIENKPKLFKIEDYYLEVLISNINKQVGQKYGTKIIGNLQQYSDWPELSRTIKAWCESGFRPNIASKKLNIHRNTLLYRLNKIEEISGVDLKDFRKTLMLYVAIIFSIVSE